VGLRARSGEVCDVEGGAEGNGTDFLATASKSEPGMVAPGLEHGVSRSDAVAEVLGIGSKVVGVRVESEMSRGGIGRGANSSDGFPTRIVDGDRGMVEAEGI